MQIALWRRLLSTLSLKYHLTYNLFFQSAVPANGPSVPVSLPASVTQSTPISTSLPQSPTQPTSLPTKPASPSLPAVLPLPSPGVQSQTQVRINNRMITEKYFELKGGVLD